MQHERVRHIMTVELLSIDVGESITEAMRLFASYQVHHLPLVAGAVLQGMLSTADMLKLQYFLRGPMRRPLRYCRTIDSRSRS